MFPIEMTHIGKIDAVGTVHVFGYSARKIDRDLHDLAYLNYAGPPTAADRAVEAIPPNPFGEGVSASLAVGDWRL